MAYVAVKGGERAIDAAHAWLAEDRRGDPAVSELDTAQIAGQLGRAVDRVMAEGACHDPGLAALAIKQAQGDMIEAAFLLRAYRTTLPRFAAMPTRWPRRAMAGAHAGSRPSTRTCPAARCSARPTTTRTACWISPSPPQWPTARWPRPLQDDRIGRSHGSGVMRPSWPPKA